MTQWQERGASVVVTFVKASLYRGGLILASRGIGALLQACRGTPTAPQAAPTTAAGGSIKVLKVGLNSVISGARATYGIGLKWGAEEAARRINQAGGVTVGGQKFEFHWQPTGSSSAYLV